METIFLNAAGTVLFVRDDMEQGNWAQEEYAVNATFPFVPGKVIQRGQRIAFRDPATNNLEMFEIRNVANIEPDHYQQIIAEHIAVSELSDEHINDTEITDKTPAQALTTALTGTLWAVGTSAVSATSSIDIARGSVWQAVLAIAENWNCYITPRVTVNAAGSITGRYLDITTTDGVFRGVRLSIDKNMADASVTVDDSEVLTALYGYGGSVEVTQTGQDDKTETLTFAGVTWTATAEHPAKPAGQTYLEDPAKTALYGRNGRARFGYYQNGDITDANTLLQKTWEALKATSEPHISITGTCADLYRLGYADQPIRLHDIAIVDIPETGETYYRKIIKCDVDLIDPTATRPEIGDYIPNIIYINRNTNEQATTGGRGGGGGGRGGSNKELDDSETFSALEKTNNMIAMVVGTRNGNNYIKAGEIGLAINKSGESGQYESTAYINADHVNISATQDVHMLAGDLEHDADGRLVIKNAGGVYVERTESGVVSYFGVFDNGNLTAGVIADKINGGNVYLKGSRVWVGDAASDQTLKKWATESDGLFATNINALSARISSIEADYITAGQITGDFITSRVGAANSMTIGNLTAGDVTSSGVMTAATLKATAFTTNSFYMGGVYLTPGNLVASVVGSSVTGGGYKFTVTQADGTSADYSFNVASSITLGGAWTGASYTATAKDPDDNVIGSVTTSISRDWQGTTLNIVSGSDTLLSEAITGGTNTGMSTQGMLYTINTFNSSHRAYGYVDAQSHPAGRLFSFNVDATSEYNGGWSAYYNSSDWERPSISNGGTVKRPGATPTTGQTAWFILSAGSEITYDPDTHTYTATGQAKIGSSVVAEQATGTASGTEAWTAGQTDGYSSGETDWKPVSIVQDTTNKLITVQNAAGGSVGQYSVATTYAAGVAEGEGHYHKAPLTLQGSPMTVYPLNGEYRYDSVTRYRADGGTFVARGTAQSAYYPTSSGGSHLRGSSVSPTYNGTLYYSNGKSAGSGYWYRSGNSTLYLGNGTSLTSATLYWGNGGTYTAAGTADTVLLYNPGGSVVLYGGGVSITCYSAGQSYSADTSPYYTRT